MGRRNARVVGVLQAIPAFGMSDLCWSREGAKMGSSLFHLRWLYFLGGGLERGAGGGHVAGGLGGGQPDVIVVTLGHQQVQQRGAALLISVSHRLADLLGLGPDAVAVATPPLYGIDVGG